MKPLVVGYAPVAGAPGDTIGVAFVDTDSGRRLARYAGLESDVELLDHFEMVNLFRDPDAAWDRDVARRRARAIEIGLVAGRRSRVILLSSPVAQAFGRPYHPLFQWTESTTCGWDYEVAVCPHPSGLVRWWNDPENVRKAGMFLDSVTGLGRELRTESSSTIPRT